ncbi:MAG: amidohydrolase family protein [Actinobacteria bacterium]|nr:amidohydrolase family protein [Actinomycetota bacterium]
MAYRVHSRALIDGTGRDPVDHGVLTITDERITDVGSASTGDGDAGGLDCSDLVVLPGLIDAHTHMGLVEGDTLGGMPAAMVAAHLFRNAELCLASGHTTAREVAGADGGLAQAIDAGLVPGPRLFPSGPMLSQTGGHGEFGPPFLDHHHHYTGLPGLSEPSVRCDGPDQVRVAARNAFRHGATQIKVCVSGGVVSLTDRLEDVQFTVPELRAAVEEAEARDTYVTAHAHNIDGILRGLEAGLACFEHGTFLTEEVAAKMAAAGAALVPTLAVIHLLATEHERYGLGEYVVPRVAGVEDAMSAAVVIAMEAGVRVGSGTDLLGPEQNRRGLELALRSRLHSPMDAIVSATRANAEVMRIADRVGTLETGKLADCIGVDFDPLAEPELFDDPDRVRLVIKDGEVVKDLDGRS